MFSKLLTISAVLLWIQLLSFKMWIQAVHALLHDASWYLQIKCNSSNNCWYYLRVDFAASFCHACQLTFAPKHSSLSFTEFPFTHFEPFLPLIKFIMNSDLVFHQLYNASHHISICRDFLSISAFTAGGRSIVLKPFFTIWEGAIDNFSECLKVLCKFILIPFPWTDFHTILHQLILKSRYNVLFLLLPLILSAGLPIKKASLIDLTLYRCW